MGRPVTIRAVMAGQDVPDLETTSGKWVYRDLHDLTLSDLTGSLDATHAYRLTLALTAGGTPLVTLTAWTVSSSTAATATGLDLDVAALGTALGTLPSLALCADLRDLTADKTIANTRRLTVWNTVARAGDA